MSTNIKSVDVVLAKELVERNNVSSDIHSLSINQVSGDFAVTLAITDGAVVIHPQSLNHPTTSLIGGDITLTTFSGFGSLNSPLDAKFDTGHGKLWIADTGNSRVLKVDAYSQLAEFSIPNLNTPYAVCPNSNTGGVFIKDFYSNVVGIVSSYSTSGVLLSSIKYADDNTLELPSPLPSTIVFDNRRNRLWWAALDKAYMLDLLNNQVTDLSLSSYNVSNTRGIDVHLDSGNVFVVVKDTVDNWSLLQIFRDNTVILDQAYLPESSIEPCHY